VRMAMPIGGLDKEKKKKGLIGIPNSEGGRNNGSSLVITVLSDGGESS